MSDKNAQAHAHMNYVLQFYRTLERTAWRAPEVPQMKTQTSSNSVCASHKDLNELRSGCKPQRTSLALSADALHKLANAIDELSTSDPDCMAALDCVRDACARKLSHAPARASSPSCGVGMSLRRRDSFAPQRHGRRAAAAGSLRDPPPEWQQARLLAMGPSALPHASALAPVESRLVSFAAFTADASDADASDTDSELEVRESKCAVVSPSASHTPDPAPMDSSRRWLDERMRMIDDEDDNDVDRGRIKHHLH